MSRSFQWVGRLCQCIGGSEQSLLIAGRARDCAGRYSFDLIYHSRLNRRLSLFRLYLPSRARGPVWRFPVDRLAQDGLEAAEVQSVCHPALARATFLQFGITVFVVTVDPNLQEELQKGDKLRHPNL